MLVRVLRVLVLWGRLCGCRLYCVGFAGVGAPFCQVFVRHFAKFSCAILPSFDENAAVKMRPMTLYELDEDRMRKPVFLAVLSGTAKVAYRREDGVLVIPIGCLGP